jgi:hypothetical protein
LFQDVFKPLPIAGDVRIALECMFNPVERLAHWERRVIAWTGIVHPAPVFAGLNQAGIGEDRKVLGDGGRGELAEFSDLADAEFAVAKGQECADAVRVRESLCDDHELEHVSINDEMNIGNLEWAVNAFALVESRAARFF